MEYRIAKGWRIFAVLFCLLFIIGGIAALSSPFLGAAKKDMTLFTILGISFIVFGIIGWLDTTRTKLTIDDHSLSIQRAFSSRSMLLDEIKGYSIREKGRIAIISKNAGSKSMLLPGYLQQDADIKEWLQQHYPDVDLVEQEVETQNILANEEFGVTKDERESRLKRAKLVCKVFNFIGVAAVAWAFFYPNPYDEGMFVLIALPLAGIFIVWSFKGLIRFDTQKKSAYPSLGGLFLFSIIALLLRIMIDFHIYDYDRMWTALVAVAIALTLICLFAAGKTIKDGKQKAILIVLFLVFNAIYSFGAIVFTNYYFDKSVPLQYTVEVKNKHISRGKSTTYYLGLDAWGRFTKEEDVSIPKNLYNLIETGDSVHVTVWNGKWNIPWFEVTP